MHAKVPSWEPKRMLKCPLGWKNTLNCPWLKHDKLPSLEPKHALKCPLHWWERAVFWPLPFKKSVHTTEFYYEGGSWQEMQCVQWATAIVHPNSVCTVCCGCRCPQFIIEESIMQLSINFKKEKQWLASNMIGVYRVTPTTAASLVSAPAVFGSVQRCEASMF